MPNFIYKFWDWGVGRSILFLLWITIKSCSLKAAQEGRIFDINYPVFLLILREENLYPLSFSEQVINYALLSSIYVMNCETQNCGQKINWVLTEFQMFSWP